MKLNTAFVTVGYPTQYRPNDGIFTHRMVKALSDRCKVRVVHLRAWRPSRPLVEVREWEGMPIVSLAIPQLPFRRLLHLNARLLTWLGFPLARQYLQTADVIHSTGVYVTGYVTSHWALTLGKPHVTQAIGDDVNIFLTERHWLGNDRKWLFTIDGFACNSQKLQDRLTELMANLSNVRVIHRGVDVQTFSPTGPSYGPQVGLPSVRFLYLGGFQTYNPKLYDKRNTKGGHVLLEAWHKVENQIGKSTLLIGGTGTDIALLNQWRSTLQRPEAVFFLDVVAPQAVPGLLRTCEIVVIPSLNEGLPNLANEAQAMERPVLGSDAGGIPETVIHGETGWIVPKGDSRVLADGFLWFFEHQADITRLGAIGRQHMIRNFNQEGSARALFSLFHEAIAHHSAQNLNE